MQPAASWLAEKRRLHRQYVRRYPSEISIDKDLDPQFRDTRFKRTQVWCFDTATARLRCQSDHMCRVRCWNFSHILIHPSMSSFLLSSSRKEKKIYFAFLDQQIYWKYMHIRSLRILNEVSVFSTSKSKYWWRRLKKFSVILTSCKWQVASRWTHVMTR